MSEERRFEATRSRVERARREGDVPRSQDLVAAVALACAGASVCVTLDALAASARTALVNAAHPGHWSPWPYAALAAQVLGISLAGAAGALVASLAQSGRIAFKAPSVKFEKLDPVAGLRRMFSREALAAGLKTLAVASAVCMALFPIVRDASGAAATGETPAGLARRTIGALRDVVGAALAVGIVFALWDAFVERMKWRRRLRMSFEELKRDQRQSEGDPLFRSRRRSAHRALLRGSIERLREAAFVVANPTHVAIALAYRPPEIAVPQVLVRALDAAALEVKRRASALGIPVVEDAQLARALLATAAIDQFIPKAVYGAVARIVATLSSAGRIAGGGRALSR